MKENVIILLITNSYKKLKRGKKTELYKLNRLVKQ